MAALTHYYHFATRLLAHSTHSTLVSTLHPHRPAPFPACLPCSSLFVLLSLCCTCLPTLARASCTAAREPAAWSTCTSSSCRPSAWPACYPCMQLFFFLAGLLTLRCCTPSSGAVPLAAAEPSTASCSSATSSRPTRIAVVNSHLRHLSRLAAAHSINNTVFAGHFHCCDVVAGPLSLIACSTIQQQFPSATHAKAPHRHCCELWLLRQPVHNSEPRAVHSAALADRCCQCCAASRCCTSPPSSH